MSFLYISLVTLFILFFSSTSWASKLDKEEIMEQLSLDSRGKTRVVKNFPDSFPEILTSRGKPLVYTKENSENFEYIGMPVGGIGAGNLYLGGDGQLWFWDIFNTNYRIGDIKGLEAYEKPYMRSKNGVGLKKLDQGFSIKVMSKEGNIEKRLNRDGFSNISFLGQYPIGQITYKDDALPVDVELEAYSPFIPLDVEKSMFPATVLNYTVKNTSNKDVEVELSGWLENAVLTQSRRDASKMKGAKLENRLIQNKHSLRLVSSARPGISKSANSVTALNDYGNMALTVIGNKNDTFSPDNNATSVDASADKKLVGRLGKRVRIKAKGETKVTFVLSWYFPNTRLFYKIGRMPISKADHILHYQHYYSEQFHSSADVADKIIDQLDELTSKTRLWRDTWYDSTLPYWFLDRTFLNISTLASSTSKILEGGLFYGSEGSYMGPGTCNHVWGYAKAMGRLFPELEKNLRRQVDFRPDDEGGAMFKNGEIRFRWESELGMAVDGQAGTILRTYVSHQMSENNSFLTEVYPKVKLAMQGLIDTNDPDHDGILTGPQHNTLDAAWYGKITWLSLHYNAALRAMAEMADEMNEPEAAKFYRDTADKGRTYIENKLFNGEFFFHESDPEHPNSPGIFTGNEYSQLFGQSWAYHVGLGEILDPAKVSKALESLWRYNFTTDVGPFREENKGGRWFAMPGESGLIACTWPNKGQEVLNRGRKLFANYNNESQNGYEYAATSLMMWHGMPYHSLAHVWYMHHDRYHGSKRNPWSEVEWGMHYARSMASYGHFTAVSGYDYHGPKGYLAFAPKITPENFRTPFTVAEGWGTFEQARTEKQQSQTIEMKNGKLSLKTLAFDVAAGIKIKKVKVKLGRKRVSLDFVQSGQNVRIELNNSLTLNVGEKLQIEMR